MKWNFLFAALIAAGIIAAAPTAHAGAHCSAAGVAGGCEPDDDDVSEAPTFDNQGGPEEPAPEQQPPSPPDLPSAPPGQPAGTAFN